MYGSRSARLEHLRWGCASLPTRPPPLQFHRCSTNYTRSQIKAELTSLNGRLIRECGEDDAASARGRPAVGAVLFWPALFFIDGDDEGTYQLAQMKGEFNALEKAAVQRNCDVAAEIQESRRAQDSYQQRRNQNYQ